jgi:serine/threonine protein kinase/Tol biopolymer transport system component
VTLAIGTRLGPYEILAPLGAGGMGEVYRARDAKLDRDVAVKILPDRLASDPDALARFEREAKAVAALSHPNILAIHDFGREGATAFAAMELLEGESLRSKLEGGALPQRRAIEIAIQIARGLAAAHEKGIVHRDVKPENLFVTSDGRVKILDFGLAKVVARETPQTSAPTTPAGTEPGTVLGTVGYMSPEQVRGREVDQRTDLFSFGAILYEMLSGRRAFKGDSQVETMNAILKEEPPELLESGRNISEGLDRIVRHCLEKAPEARFHSAGDVAFALEALSSSAPALPSGKIALVRASRWLRPAVGTAVVVAAIAVGILLDRAMRPQSSAPSFQRLTSRRGSVSAARFAADGRTVAYSAQWEGKSTEIFSVASAGQESRPLGLGEAMLVSVSSADELALKLRPKLFSGQLHGTLARVPLSGGSPRELLEDVLDADWSPDGSSLAIVHNVGGIKFVIEYPVGKPRLEEHDFVRFLRVSPDGRRIALAEGLSSWGSPSLVLMDGSGGRKVLSADDATGLAWGRDGKEIWLTSDEPGGATNLWAVDLSGRRRLVFRAAGSTALRDISRSGDLLVCLVRRQSSVMYRAPGESRESDLAWHDGNRAVDISPDGRALILSEGKPGVGPGDVFYLRRTDGTPAIRLGEGIANQFSPDGKWVLAQEKGTKRTLLLVPTGAGEPRRIPAPVDISQAWLFPDGRRILVSGILPSGLTRVYSIDLEGRGFRQIAPDGFDTFIGEMAISPDGKLVALNGSGMSNTTLQLFPADGGAAREVPGFEKDDIVIRWVEDGRSLFVFKRNAIPAPVFRLDVVTGRRTPWLELMPSDTAGITRIPTVVLSADGRSCAYNFTRELSDLYVIRGLR